jgi:hypothetical protein
MQQGPGGGSGSLGERTAGSADARSGPTTTRIWYPQPGVEAASVSIGDRERAENPLLALWFDTTCMEVDEDPWSRIDRFQERQAAREEAILRYAFAIPDGHALDVLAAHAPIVEMGAGTGYWARLLRDRGVDVVAYDAAPGYGGDEGAGVEMYTEVLTGAPEVLAEHADRTLLLVWPPLWHEGDDEEDMSVACLDHWHGRFLVYVGDWGVATASQAFHDRLRTEFTEVASHVIPQWEDVHDRLWVLERR